MFERLQYSSLFFVCNDCISVHKVVGDGISENEIVITDLKEEDL